MAKREFGAVEINGGPWCEFTNPKTGEKILVNDVIADNFLQQILLRPQDYSVVATLNLNGDFMSDALAAQVGGIGIAPGANLSDTVAMFEATHGTAPRFAGMSLRVHSMESSDYHGSEDNRSFIGLKPIASISG